MLIHVVNASATLANRAGNHAHILFRSDSLYSHDRLQERRIGLHKQVSETDPGCFNKGVFTGIDLMIRAVGHGHLHVHHRIPGKRTTFHGLDDTLLNRRNVLRGNVATLDFRIEREAASGILGFDAQTNMSVLATTTRLLGMLVLALNASGSRFSISDLGTPNFGHNTEFALQTLHQDLKMEFAHSRNDRLVGLVVESHRKGRILIRKLMQRCAHLLAVSTCLRHDANRNNRGRELNALQKNWVVTAAKRITRARVGQTYHAQNVTAAGIIYRFLPDSMHPQETSHTLLFLLGAVVNHRAGLD